MKTRYYLIVTVYEQGEYENYSLQSKTGYETLDEVKQAIKESRAWYDRQGFYTTYFMYSKTV